MDADPSTTVSPLVVLFERDDAIAVPLLSQLRIASYDVRAARTPVDLFDICTKHQVALVLVDLGCATASRREFWVALDAHRQGRQLQVMTFRYTPPGSLLDSDFEMGGRAVADVEVRGAQDFQMIINGVRQRVPVVGSAPGIGGALAPLGLPAPTSAAPFGALGSQPQPFGSPFSPMPYSPPSPPPFSQPAPFAPSFGYAGGQPHQQQQMYATPASSPFAHPGEVNPFAFGAEASPFAQPYSKNPFADVAPSPSAPPPMSAPAHSDPFARNPFAQPGGGNFAPPPANSFEDRAARLSDAYAAQFGIQDAPPEPTARFGAVPGGPSSAGGWNASDQPFNGFGGGNGLGGGRSAFEGFGALHESSAPGLNGHNGFGGGQNGNGHMGMGAMPGANGHGRGAPVSDVWTPPDMEGETGVVPEMKYSPIGGTVGLSGGAQARQQTWDAASLRGGNAAAVEAHQTLHHVPGASRLPAVQEDQALGTVLVEGALLSADKLEVLKGIQQMLNSVEINFKLGELAMMFKFLSPDQFLAALLVSRGMVSPQQIAGLGRVKQELAASGMDYDLETLLTMFHILPAEQLRRLRAELG